MFDKEKITLDDIESEGKPLLEYVSENDLYQKEFNNYNPEEDQIEQLKKIIDEQEEKITVKAFGAEWCSDCKIQLPRIAKMTKILGKKRIEGEAFTKIKTKAKWGRKKGEPIWKSPPSPPETVDPKFDMFHIPAFYFFNKNGKCLGKIDEYPENKKTNEAELLYFLKNF